MRDALAADLRETGSVEILSLDDRLPKREAFQQAAGQADATIIIAPEFDEILANLHRWAAAAGARVLGCSQKTVELAAHKQHATEHLARHGLPVPQGLFLTPGRPLPRDFAYPAILKPVDGAGSLDIRWISGPDDLTVLPPHKTGWRLERFCPGIPASIAFLCGPNGAIALPACRQILAGVAADEASPFAYRGGQLPLPPPLDRRARQLGQRVVASLDGPAYAGNTGWLGIDLVLGTDLDGADDVVIEINPRLTTSYLGLRRLARENLAAALLAVADGGPARLSFRTEPLQFAPDGRCLIGCEPGVD